MNLHQRTQVDILSLILHLQALKKEDWMTGGQRRGAGGKFTSVATNEEKIKTITEDEEIQEGYKTYLELHNTNKNKKKVEKEGFRLGEFITQGLLEDPRSIQAFRTGYNRSLALPDSMVDLGRALYGPSILLYRGHYFHNKAMNDLKTPDGKDAVADLLGMVIGNGIEIGFEAAIIAAPAIGPLKSAKTFEDVLKITSKIIGKKAAIDVGKKAYSVFSNHPIEGVGISFLTGMLWAQEVEKISEHYPEIAQYLDADHIVALKDVYDKYRDAKEQVDIVMGDIRAITSVLSMVKEGDITVAGVKALFNLAKMAYKTEEFQGSEFNQAIQRQLLEYKSSNPELASEIEEAIRDLEKLSLEYEQNLDEYEEKAKARAKEEMLKRA